MLRYSLRLNTHNSLPLKNRITSIFKWFWQFSNFYGEYNSLSPQDRSKFVEQYSRSFEEGKGKKDEELNHKSNPSLYPQQESLK